MYRKLDKNFYDKMGGLLLTALLFSLYGTFPYVGAVSMLHVLIRLLCYFVVSMAVCILGYSMLRFLLPRIHCRRIEAVIYGKWSGLCFFLCVWAIILVGWTPAYLAFFPGIFGYDAPNQMQQILSNTYSSHHPLLHTLILKVFMNTGKAVFGTYNGGVALMCIFQGVVVSGSISYTILVMRTCKTPFPVLAASLAWCVWNPVLQVLTFNTTKDILFGVLFLYFVLNGYNWLKYKTKRTTFQIIWLIVSGILMCLLRNQGIYIVAALVLVGVFAYSKERRFLICLCAVIAGSQIFFSVTNHIFGVQKGDMREMLSVPMQQTALVCKLYMEGEAVSLTPEEFEKFSLLVDKEYIPQYHLSTADPIKMHFNTEAFRQDWGEYLALYLKVGARNPGHYLTAFRCLAYPYWEMSEFVARDISISNTFPDLSQEWGISQQSLLPGYKEYLSNYILHEMDEKIPVVSWFLQPGLCIWLMTALLGMGIAHRDKAAGFSALSGMLFLGTLLLGPVALLRYIYPLMLLTPWFLALVCNALVKGKQEEEW